MLLFNEVVLKSRWKKKERKQETRTKTKRPNNISFLQCILNLKVSIWRVTGPVTQLAPC